MTDKKTPVRPRTAAPAPDQAPQSVSKRAEVGTDLRPENLFRVADRNFHSVLAMSTFGLSPVSAAGAWLDWGSNFSIAPGKQYETVLEAFRNWVRLQSYLVRRSSEENTKPCIEPLPQDRRFHDPSWKIFPFDLYQQSFLLAQQWLHHVTTGVEGVSAEHERMVEFNARQWLDIFSPSNFAATNPVVLQQTMKEGGSNFFRGSGYLADDVARAMRLDSPAGAEAFGVGRNIAVTPGKVVLRNELIELIQYSPTTKKVHPEPILIVPAWIMKYYILDLSPKNSMVRYLIEQGFTVFCISWRNPGADMRDTPFDDYRRLGMMAALDAVQTVTGSDRIHAAGYCLGGTLLSIGASAMARDGDERLATVTLFCAQVDFEEPGELGLFVNESQISFLEDVMWRDGYLDQQRMAGAFQMMRSQDLVWSRVVHEYLMGQRAPMTDLMAWNADATRMPYRMHSEYLRSLFLNNDLAQGRFRVGGHPIHVEDIKAPTFVVGTETDHVAPWRSVFKITHLFDTDVDFVLTSGGHNAGIVSEPGHPHRSYKRLSYRHGQPHPDPELWASSAQRLEGSWWPAWTGWLRDRSGNMVALPPMGRKPFKIVCDAPGTYVHER